jgi:hypothetical protein
LEPEDLGWWYTVNKSVKFWKCKVCKQQRGDDLDKETRVTHTKECKGCDETFQKPTKTGGKRTMGKGKQPTTKRVHMQVVTQRELHPRSHKVRYSFIDEEGGRSDTDIPDEIQGYLCVSTDPRRTGLIRPSLSHEKYKSFLFNRLDLLKRTDPGEEVRNVEYML